MSVFSHVINHTIFPPAHLSVSLLLAEIRLAGWSVAFVCLCACFCWSVPALQPTMTVKERSSPGPGKTD